MDCIQQKQFFKTFEQAKFVQDVTVIEPLGHSNNIFYKHYFLYENLLFVPFRVCKTVRFQRC